MIVFAIPFRGKNTANDWNGCVKRLNNTLNSIFNQTDNEFKVIVACNDIPKLNKKYDERLEFIVTDIPIPKKWLEMAIDKSWKLTVIAIRIREILLEQNNPENGIYVMPVDADDLLNCNIAKYVKEHPYENGFVSKDGYVHYKGNNYLTIYKNMHTYCGSCNIIKMYLEDLPEDYPIPVELCHDIENAKILNKKYPIRFDHNIVVNKYKENGKEFSILPFRSTIYIKDTGDNISDIHNQEKGLNKNDNKLHIGVFIKKINPFTKKRFSKKIYHDFGIDYNNN
ncbi:hypothetical protein [Intestinibacter bartlettii]|uniref:hypothetical protein n=1 Tax=Intestinibacter bartlettii TaxID=261299 RepID=UPI00321BCBFE